MSRIVDLWLRANGITPAKAEEVQVDDPAQPADPTPKREPARFDAMASSQAAYRARLASLSLDVPLSADLCTQGAPRPRPDDDLAAVVAEADEQRARAEAERAAQLEAGAVDGRTASPEQIRARLQQLGVLSPGGGSIPLHDAHGVFEPQGFRGDDDQASAPQPGRPTPEELHARRVDEAEQVVEAVILDAVRRGISVDTRKFDSVELDAYLRKRGLTARDRWAGARAL